MNYRRFLAMIATSTVVMFGLMYLNTYLLPHVFWSETRAYMAVLMGASMAIVMLAFMASMYPSRSANAAIFAVAAVVFAGSLWLVRSQVTVEDRSYMRAMIPHHSIAIMTSSRANITDARVRKLADEIIYAQDKEIAEMRYLVSDIGRNGKAAGGPESAPARLMSLREALSSAEVAVVDPEFLTPEEIARAFPQGAACRFAYTEDSKPVLAVAAQDGGAAALVKLSGGLVRLEASDGTAPEAGPELGAEGMSLRLSGWDGEALADGPGRRKASLRLEIEQGLSAGYSGYYTCAG